MGKKHMQKLAIYGISSLLMICLLNSGCFDSIISDWEYEYHYYIEIQTNSTDNFSVFVPLPDASYYNVERQRYLDNYVNNLIIESGVCTFNVVEHNSEMYVQINASSSISISSTFTLWDAYANISIDSEEGALRTMIFSDSSNISLIIDSRAVRKTNERNTWDLYYSTVINPDMDFPIPTKNTWKEHLSDEYFFAPQLGWNSYSIQEDTNWNNRLIR